MYWRSQGSAPEGGSEALVMEASRRFEKLPLKASAIPLTIIPLSCAFGVDPDYEFGQTCTPLYEPPLTGSIAKANRRSKASTSEHISPSKATADLASDRLRLHPTF